MNVFVTGASGGLGAALAELLQARGHSLTLLSRRQVATAGLARSVSGDLLRPDSYAAALPGHQAVLHLAALTHSADPDQYYAVNARGTELLLEAAAEAGVGRFLFVSTRAIGRACGAYGESKALAEAAVRASGLDWTILRPGEVYGASAGEAVGRTIAQVRSGFVVPYVAHSRALLAPVHRDDVLGAVAAALDAPASIGQTYTLAGPEEFTQAGMIRRLRRLYPGLRLPVPVPVPLLRLAALLFRAAGLAKPPFVPDQIPRLLCIKERHDPRARADLGFVPRRLEDGLDA
jgi:nucleoside-diphosphate-sugar epimerase